MISFRRIMNNCIRSISISVMKYEWKRNLILILAIISTSALLSAMTLNTFFYEQFPSSAPSSQNIRPALLQLMKTRKDLRY